MTTRTPTVSRPLPLKGLNNAQTKAKGGSARSSSAAGLARVVLALNHAVPERAVRARAEVLNSSNLKYTMARQMRCAYQRFVKGSEAYLVDNKIKSKRRAFILSYFMEGKAYDFYIQRFHAMKSSGPWIGSIQNSIISASPSRILLS